MIIKKSLTVIFMLLGISHIFSSEIIPSKITDVMVYKNGAKIARTADFNLKAGLHEIVIDNVSPYVDAKSIQVNFGGQLVLMDTRFSRYFPSPEEIEAQKNKLPLVIQKKISALQDSILDKDLELTLRRSELEVTQQAKQIILKNGMMRGEGKIKDSLAMLKSAVDYYLQRMNALQKEEILLNRSVKKLQTQKSDMDHRLQLLLNYSKAKDKTHPPTNHRIILTVMAEKPVKNSLSLNYFVGNAGWQPIYDIHASSTMNDIEIHHKASIHQNTGVAWEGVKLGVSTNDPFQNKTKPELQPWLIIPAEFYKNAQRNQLMEFEEVAVEADSRFRKDKNEGSNFAYATSADFTTVQQQLLSVEFLISLPYTIQSNNQKHLVSIKKEKIKTDYHYYAVPKLSLDVYLVAKISDLKDKQLLPAKANIFFENGFIGETYIQPQQMNDTMSISLGVDPNINISRTFVTKNKKEKFIGNDVVKSSEYEIEVANNTNKEIKIIVQDQVPISRDEAIKVSVDDIGKGKINTRTGLVEWELKMKSKESKKLPLSYSVRYNKNLKIFWPE